MIVLHKSSNGYPLENQLVQASWLSNECLWWGNRNKLLNAYTVKSNFYAEYLWVVHMLDDYLLNFLKEGGISCAHYKDTK